MTLLHTSHSQPPEIRTERLPNHYVSYFTHASGEHWIYAYNHLTRTADLCGGQTNAPRLYPHIPSGSPQDNFFMGSTARCWLHACQTAAALLPS